MNSGELVNLYLRRPDPLNSSGIPGLPQSWNRYSYAIIEGTAAFAGGLAGALFEGIGGIFRGTTQAASTTTDAEALTLTFKSTK